MNVHSGKCPNCGLLMNFNLSDNELLACTNCLGEFSLSDIRDLDEKKDIPDFDIMLAGFPCQAFSVAGYRQGFNDEKGRGNLFFEIGRIIDIKRPPIVFLENVANLMEHDDGKTFLVIYNTLAQFGYAVKYKVLDFINFSPLFLFPRVLFSGEKWLSGNPAKR